MLKSGPGIYTTDYSLPCFSVGFQPGAQDKGQVRAVFGCSQRWWISFLQPVNVVGKSQFTHSRFSHCGFYGTHQIFTSIACISGARFADFAMQWVTKSTVSVLTLLNIGTG